MTPTTLHQEPLSFYLRKIDEPFDVKCMLLYNEPLRQELLKWVATNSKLQIGTKSYMHTVACEISSWIAYCFPETTDIRKFKNVFYWFQMFATMDDHADEKWGDPAHNTEATKKFWKKAIKLVETLRDEAPWHVKLLRDILLRKPGVPHYMRKNFQAMKTIMNELSPTQRNRHINCFKTYMEHASIQAQMKGKEKNTTLEQYKEYRLKSIASMPCTLMMEYLYDIELTEAEYSHPNLKKMERAGTLQVALINDLFSLFKEYEGTLENLNHSVSILVQNKKITTQEAVNTVCDEIEALQNEFISIKKEWQNSGESISENLMQFINGFEYYMAGNARWHRFSKRYHGIEFNTVITSGIMEWSPNGTLYTTD